MNLREGVAYLRAVNKETVKLRAFRIGVVFLALSVLGLCITYAAYSVPGVAFTIAMLAIGTTKFLSASFAARRMVYGWWETNPKG